MAPWLVGVVVAGVAGYVAGARGAGSGKSPPFVAAPEREAEELAKAASERPTSWDGRKKTDAVTWSDWLGWVAYRRAHPLGPKEPRVSRSPHYHEALERMRAAAAQLLG